MLIARVARHARSAMSRMACCVWRYTKALFEVSPVKAVNGILKGQGDQERGIGVCTRKVYIEK
jgi:hypothetical protein